MTTTSVPAAFRPSDPAFVADPYPGYAELRDGPAVAHHAESDLWLVPRFRDVDELLRDRRLGRTYLHRFSHADLGQPDDPDHLAPFWRTIRAGMLDLEPPDHTRLRRLVSKAFTPRMVASLRPRVQAMTDELVDRLAANGGGDLIAEFAEPLPVAIIAEMLGVPDSDRHQLRPWSARICGMYELNPSEETGRIASEACVEFGDYLRELARARRAEPRDDLVTALVQVVDDGDVLTEDELVGTCVLLLNAGHEATVNTTGNGWLALFRHPEALGALRDDPSLAPTAVEELLRFDTPLHLFERWVLDDIEIGGVTVPRGAQLGLLFGSANRDPVVFSDPDTLDLRRRPNPHLGFGAGIHFCLGAPLARLELETSFATLVRRLPTMRLVEEPAWKPTYIIRGLESLRVEL